jgi:hypothetical protein
MSQSKRSSFVEAVINTAVGYVIAFCGQLVIYPAYGATFSLLDNIQIGVWFMLLSLARSYVIRRWFNRMIVRAAQKLAHEARQPTQTQPESYRHEGYGSVYDEVERISLDQRDK